MHAQRARGTAQREKLAGQLRPGASLRREPPARGQLVPQRGPEQPTGLRLRRVVLEGRHPVRLWPPLPRLRQLIPTPGKSQQPDQQRQEESERERGRFGSVGEDCWKKQKILPRSRI